MSNSEDHGRVNGVMSAGSVLDGSKIEVVLSKPVDRETYQYVKSAKAAAQVT